MNKSKIEWCDLTWNPVTGCHHGCPYCYARRIAQRFAPKGTSTQGVHELDEKTDSPFPFGFDPTLHRCRLEEPKNRRKPATIFVGSMCDLFGAWVPLEWIEEVMEACNAAPWHRYLFLTKNYGRVDNLQRRGRIPGHSDTFWFGATVTTVQELAYLHANPDFVSIEPISAPFYSPSAIVVLNGIPWVTIGAETGNRAGRAIPSKGWFEGIVQYRLGSGRAVFVKDSLKHLLPDGAAPKVLPW